MGKAPKRAAIVKLYSRGKRAESEFSAEMAEEIKRKAALNRKTNPVYRRTT